MAPTQLKSGKKRVLVIEGAGFRSFGTLVALDVIMTAASFRARKPLSPSDVFDIICGSSGGGLVAVLVGRLGLDCKAAIAVYRRLAEKLSDGRNETAFLKSMLDSFDSETNSTAFDSFLAKVLEEHALSTGSEPTFVPSNPSDGEHAETFVPVACLHPLSNRTYNVRSYPTPLGAPPLRHKWTNYEVARASLATRFILPPMVVAEKFSFRDPAFVACGNPIKWVKKELDTRWPKEGMSIVLNLGIDLQPFESPEVTSQFLAKFPEEKDRNDKETQSRASFIIKGYEGAAIETELAWTDALNQRIFPSDVLVRLDPTTGLTSSDLVDIFKFDEVEKSVKRWLLGEGKDLISGIINELVETGSKDLELDKPLLRNIPPPPPPPTTNSGYNPSLDEPRPETMIGYLEHYHVVFVVDDSGSMKGSRWIEAQEALLEIADYAKLYNCRDVDVRFLNNKKVYPGVQGRETIRKIFTEIGNPQGYTPTGTCLADVTRDHLAILDDAVNKPIYRLIRPLDIIVLTDGVPTDSPGEVLAGAVRHRDERRHHPNAIGVQIVQIGDDNGAGPAMESLMREQGVQSMVDTFKYDDRHTVGGRLTAQELERILLGGLHPNVRALLPKSMGGQA